MFDSSVFLLVPRSETLKKNHLQISRIMSSLLSPPWARGGLRGETALLQLTTASVFRKPYVHDPLSIFTPCETFTFFLRTPSGSREVFYHPPPHLPRPLKPASSTGDSMYLFCGTRVLPNFPAINLGSHATLHLNTILC